MKKFLWVDEYAPNTVDDCILPDSIKSVLVGYRDTGVVPNVILSSGPGQGKTSSMLALAKDLDLDVLFINGSNEGRYLATIQNIVTDFCSTVSFTQKRKLVFFDEFDNSLPDVQLCLRGIIEKFQNNTSFVFSCNTYGKIIEPIKSRCATIHYTPSKDDAKSLKLQVFKRLQGILMAEEVTYDPKILAEVVKNFYPDIRKIINELQKFSVTGELCISVLSSASTDNIHALMTLMKDKKRFNDVRKWCSDNSDLSSDSIFKAVGDKLNDYLQPGSIAAAIIILADYSYRAAFCADQEINICACLLDISYSCNFIE